MGLRVNLCASAIAEVLATVLLSLEGTWGSTGLSDMAKAMLGLAILVLLSTITTGVVNSEHTLREKREGRS